MILEYWEICNPKSSIQNGRNALVKYLGAVAGGSALLHRGLNERELVQVEKFFPQEHLAHERERSHDFSKILEKIRSWVSSAKPAVLRYSYGSGKLDHYVVTVGTGDSSIYVMGPGVPASEGSLYNNFIRIDGPSWIDMDNREITKIGPAVAIYRTGFRPNAQKLWLPRTEA